MKENNVWRNFDILKLSIQSGGWHLSSQSMKYLHAITISTENLWYSMSEHYLFSQYEYIEYFLFVCLYRAFTLLHFHWALFSNIENSLYSSTLFFNLNIIWFLIHTFGWSRTGTATRTATFMGLSLVISNILLFSDDIGPV